MRCGGWWHKAGPHALPSPSPTTKKVFAPCLLVVCSVFVCCVWFVPFFPFPPRKKIPLNSVSFSSFSFPVPFLKQSPLSPVPVLSVHKPNRQERSQDGGSHSLVLLLCTMSTHSQKTTPTRRSQPGCYKETSEVENEKTPTGKQNMQNMYWYCRGTVLREIQYMKKYTKRYWSIVI